MDDDKFIFNALRNLFLPYLIAEQWFIPGGYRYPMLKQLSPIRKDAKLPTIAFSIILTPPYCSHLIYPMMFDTIIGFT